MKTRSALVPLALTILASACAASSDTASVDPEVPFLAPPAATRTAAPSANDTTTPSGAPNVALPQGVFVAARGDDAGDGSAAHPVRTLARAIEKAQKQKLAVIACAERFAEQLTLSGGSVSIRGGYDCTTPEWRKSDARTKIYAPTSPALRATDLAELELEQVDISTDDVVSGAPNDVASSIAVDIRRTIRVHITRSSLAAARGRDGRDAVVPPAYRLDGGNGAAATYGFDCTGITAASCYDITGPRLLAGGKGGAGQCLEASLSALPSSLPANPGGDGGRGGYYGNDGRSVGGLMGLPDHWIAGVTREGGAPTWPGNTGNDGDDGGDGASGHARVTKAGYERGDSVVGADGARGMGGGGGGGDAHPVSGPAITASGAGGGAGGCPGRAPRAAEGGGASIALFVDAGDVVLDQVRLSTREGGRGGRGGFGTMPTAGASGGAGIPLHSGSGGNGGRGGRAGFTGHGAGGSAYGMVYTGAVPKLDAVTFAVGTGALAQAPISEGGRTIPAGEAGERAETKAAAQ